MKNVDNGYPKRRGRRRRGYIDEHQSWIASVYRPLIHQVLADNPGSLIGEITKKTSEARKVWLQSDQEVKNSLRTAPKRFLGKHHQIIDVLSRELPKGRGVSRSTVRQHLKAMVKAGEVEKIGDRYVLRQSTPFSDELDDAVKKTLHGHIVTNWTFPHAPNVAGAYLVSDSKSSTGAAYSLLEPQVDKFRDSLFWIKDITLAAMTQALVTENVYSSTTDSLDVDSLTRAFKKLFENSELLILAFAFNPKVFAEYLKTPVGKALATQQIRSDWNHLLEQLEQQRLQESRVTQQMQHAKESLRRYSD